MSNFLSINQNQQYADLAKDIAAKLGQADPAICLGSCLDGANFIISNKISPKFIMIEIGDFYPTFFSELESLAQHCTVGTKVVVIGNVNDLNFYRELIKKGVTEYFVKPVSVDDIAAAFSVATAKTAPQVSSEPSQNGKAISFLCSASGDGATTVAINTAYTLATKYNAPTVLLDMDYQFGLVARNLDLSFSAGLKDLYEQSGDDIDETFLEKTIIPYKNNLFIIPAPRELGVMPTVNPQTLINAIQLLKKKFKYVIIDVPHIWSDWVSVVINEVDRHVMVSQLNLKSVTHASRLIEAFVNNGVARNKISILVNRSGSKLKEPFSASEFALATKQKVEFYIANDSRTIALSEDRGQTAVEVGSSLLNKQFEEFALALTKV